MKKVKTVSKEKIEEKTEEEVLDMYGNPLTKESIEETSNNKGDDENE